MLGVLMAAEMAERPGRLASLLSRAGQMLMAPGEPGGQAGRCAHRLGQYLLRVTRFRDAEPGFAEAATGQVGRGQRHLGTADIDADYESAHCAPRSAATWSGCSRCASRKTSWICFGPNGQWWWYLAQPR